MGRVLELALGGLLIVVLGLAYFQWRDRVRADALAEVRQARIDSLEVVQDSLRNVQAEVDSVAADSIAKLEARIAERQVVVVTERTNQDSILAEIDAIVSDTVRILVQSLHTSHQAEVAALEDQKQSLMLEKSQLERQIEIRDERITTLEESEAALYEEIEYWQRRSGSSLGEKLAWIGAGVVFDQAIKLVSK